MKKMAKTAGIAKKKNKKLFGINNQFDVFMVI